MSYLLNISTSNPGFLRSSRASRGRHRIARAKARCGMWPVTYQMHHKSNQFSTVDRLLTHVKAQLRTQRRSAKAISPD